MTDWVQKTITVKASGRGCELITDQVVSALGEDLKKFSIGIAHLFIQHTSASLSVNEHDLLDAEARKDMETVLNDLVPEDHNSEGLYLHADEGKDDMPAHVKTTLCGVSVSVPITDGRFNLGFYQGIWFNEHRTRPSTRTLVVTLQGKLK